MKEPSNSLQCENLGEISFDCLKRNQLNTPPKIVIKNLPEGITKEGIENLFYNIGKPVSVNFFYSKATAIVEFQSINQAELAVRDLHKKPPYNLTVSLISLKKFNCEPKVKNNENSWEGSWTDNYCMKLQKYEWNELHSESNCNSSKLKSLYNNSDYPDLKFNPSLRMRQKVFDFKTKSHSVSFGRGYMNMGKIDCFVGGLSSHTFTSKECSFNDKANLCTNCQFSTLKKCDRCSAAFCSKYCSSHAESHTCKEYWSVEKEKNNKKNSKVLQNEAFTRGDSQEDSDLCFSKARNLSCIPFESPCTVVMTMYTSFKTVYVRIVDSPWDEEFNKMSNNIAIEALKDEKLDTLPEVGELYTARYYEDMCFYRVRIHSVEKDIISVFFLDFGNIQETKLTDIKPLSEEFRLFPSFSTLVELKDIPEGTSDDGVKYFNRLTSEMIPLTMKYEGSISNKVWLIEKDSEENVNRRIKDLITPSWKKDPDVLSKLGDVFYYKMLNNQAFGVDEKYNIIISHFDEDEFISSGSFWVNNVDSDYYFHVKGELKANIYEYCEFLKNDYYLPRVNELCLAQYKDEWHRCVSLANEGIECLLFFVDDGFTSLTKTCHIRKMIEDFLKVPSQAIRCVLAGNLKIKEDQNLQSKVKECMKTLVGKTLKSVHIKFYKETIFHLSINEIEKLLSE